LEYEEKNERQPIDMNEDDPNHPGYDIESRYEEKGGTRCRYIEVKSKRGQWKKFASNNTSLAHLVALTPRQTEEALKYGEDYWLYVVEHAEKDELWEIYEICNPAGVNKLQDQHQQEYERRLVFFPKQEP
jgi:hypothetical protein